MKGVVSSYFEFVLPKFHLWALPRRNIFFEAPPRQIKPDYLGSSYFSLFSHNSLLMMFFLSTICAHLTVQSCILICTYSLFIDTISLALAYDTFESFPARLFLFYLHKTPGRLSWYQWRQPYLNAFSFWWIQLHSALLILQTIDAY